jgi:hypothetical protein
MPTNGSNFLTLADYFLCLHFWLCGWKTVNEILPMLLTTKMLNIWAFLIINCCFRSCSKILVPVAAQSEALGWSLERLNRGFESRLRHGCLSSSFCVMLSCVGRGFCDGLIIRPKESYQVSKQIKKPRVCEASKVHARTIEPWRTARQLIRWVALPWEIRYFNI